MIQIRRENIDAHTARDGVFLTRKKNFAKNLIDTSIWHFFFPIGAYLYHTAPSLDEQILSDILQQRIKHDQSLL